MDYYNTTMKIHEMNKFTGIYEFTRHLWIYCTYHGGPPLKSTWLRATPDSPSSLLAVKINIYMYSLRNTEMEHLAVMDIFQCIMDIVQTKARSRENFCSYWYGKKLFWNKKDNVQEFLNRWFHTVGFTKAPTFTSAACQWNLVVTLSQTASKINLWIKLWIDVSITVSNNVHGG
jgi:hypothetical protein